MLTPKHPRNPVTAFFRGLYAELAFSGESLRINGVGLLFGLVTGLVVGVCGGVFAVSVKALRSCAASAKLDWSCAKLLLFCLSR
mgnify:CR=1 FL=1